MDATDLAYAGAAEQARLIRAGEVSARELTETTLARIDRLNPRLNAYRVVFHERALAEADQADARRSSGQDRPLLGVPVAIKDDADVAGVPTAFGSLATSSAPKPVDSDVVVRLRSAGAVIVGKTNVPELTIWPFTESLGYGAARNPWNDAYTPGGSSGGTGAAVAAGLCGVALGSDGAGSIRIPASFNGLFGIKPQRDRISLGPDHHDGWQGLAQYGPLARHVADAALFLDATADGAPAGGYAAALAEPLARLRVALSWKAPPGAVARLGAEQRAAIEDTAAALRELGHTVVEHEIDYGPGAFTNVLVRYLRGIADDAAVLPHPERLELRSRGMARMGRLIPQSRVDAARRAEATLAGRINTIFDHCDVVLLPGAAGPPFRVGELNGRGTLWTLNAAAARVPFYGVWNAIGQPAMSVPAGFDALGLPLAAHLAGRPGDERTLLRLAAQLEQARPWADRRPPVDKA
ncbi:MAG: amidase [Solirubrobacteraceae bacterium]|jgi:amidase|nr:amidase [Solirubrobacteraceae bacterium]